MYNINLNQGLLELVEGKDIALVGPAPYLINSSRGPEFDSADIVVRINEIIPPRNLRNDYGSRTDVLFCNFGTPWMPGIKRKIALDDHKQHFKNLKLAVCSAIKSEHSEVNYLSWPDDYVSNVVKNFNDINEFNLPFYWVGVKDYKTLYSAVGAEYNTGMAAIMMLLCYPIKSLKLSGFTFYLGGNRYEDLYYEGHMDKEDLVGRTWGFSSGHGYDAHIKQIQHFKKIHNEFKNIIIIDEELQEILYPI